MSNIHLPQSRRVSEPDAWTRINNMLVRAPRHTFIALLLVSALLAFEIFNFGTTKYALADLLGHVTFMGMTWAAILAFAFCAIDFAGLVRIFTPEQGANEPKEVWYLMGAWLMGATLNAVMTWYAVSLTLLQRPLNTSEVLTQDQLLTYVPVFVAVLVWVTRILFIGSLSMAGEEVLTAARQDSVSGQNQNQNRKGNTAVSNSPRPTTRNRPPAPAPMRAAPHHEPVREAPPAAQPTTSNRVRQRPPLAGGPTSRPVTPMRASSRERR